MKNRRMFWLFLFVGGIASFVSSNCRAQVSFTILPTGNPGEYIFRLSGLPALPADKPLACYKIFLNTDDGHWYSFLGNRQATTIEKTHIYVASANYHPSFEYCPVYDDTQTDPPPVPKPYNNGGIFDPSTNIFTGTIAPPAYFTGRMVDIVDAWRIVPGHLTTFAVSYKNPGECLPIPITIAGTLVFEYDASVLEVDPTTNNGLVTFQNYQEGVATKTIIGNLGQISIPVNSLPSSAQRSLFLRFRTKIIPNVQVGQTLSPVPKVTFVPDKEGYVCPSMATNFTLTTMSTVELAHDPNRKTVAYVMDNGTPKLEYTIHFQNDGHRPVNDVSITDELDKLLPCIPSLTTGMIVFPALTHIQSSFPITLGANRTFTIKLKDLYIRGTKEPRYGIDFGEDATKGYLKFRIPLCNSNELPPCSAILNRASIRFDCNPPIETVLAKLDINCFGNPVTLNLPPPAEAGYGRQIVNQICATDSLVIDTLPTTPFIPANVNITGYTDYKWYPETGLNLSDPQQPILTDLKNNTYTLIASKGCERLILTRIVRVPCTLVLGQPTISGYPNGPFTVTCSIPTDYPRPVEWQKCPPPPNGTSFSYNGVACGTYYFSVYDPVTGCSDEKWVTTMTVSDDPSDCQADLVIQGGTGAYSYLWSYTQGGQLHYSTQGPNFNLQGKDNATVTVTDGGGNSVVFQPGKECRISRPWPFNNVWGLLGVLGAAIAIFISIYIGKRRRP